MEIDGTPSSPVGSVSVGILPDVILDGDHVAILDAKQVEQVDLIAAKGTKAMKVGEEM